MATILEGALWTLTEAAAERMVENGLLERCGEKHSCIHVTDGVPADKPFYHIAKDAPSWFGVHSIPDAIITAESHVEEETDKAILIADDLKIHEITFDPTMNPEPGQAGYFEVKDA